MWRFAFPLLVLPLSLPAAEPESLLEFAKQQQSRHALGLYVQDKKVGWLVTATKLVQKDGKFVVVESSELKIKMLADGEATEIGETSESVFAVEGEGTLLSAEERVIHDKQETVYQVTRAGDKIKIVTTVGKRTTTREIPVPKASLVESQRLVQWLTGGPKPGATFTHHSTSWEEADVNVKETLTYRGKKSIVWAGVKTEVYLVTITSRGAVYDAEVLSNGNPIKGKIGGLIEMRAETELVARKLEAANIDLIDASSVRPDKDLGQAHLVTALTLEIRNAPDLSLPASHRQRIAKENGKMLLILQADSPVKKATPLSDAEKKQFTSATPTVQSDQEPIQKLAKKIVGDETDPLKQAEKLKTWVYSKVRKTMACNASTALAILDNMAGDCTEHTLLFVSLARAVGLPARELTGLAFVSPVFGWHAWAEIHDGRQWVSVDPTWNQLFVDATHIVFANDSNDHAWINVLGKVQFVVSKVEKK